MLISLSGYAGSGKDSVADVLVAKHGFVKYAWADTLRLAASILNPIVHSDEHGAIYRYNEVVEEYGYNNAKFKYPEVRRFLQILGTEVGRELISDTVWVDATLKRIRQECSPIDDIVITDTRFINEVRAVKTFMGDAYAVRVCRPGVLAANNHASEVELDGFAFDFTLVNDGSLFDLESKVEAMLTTTEIYNWGLQSR